MNYKMVLKTVGRLLWAEAALLCLPLFVSLYYYENLFHIYLIVMGLLLVAGAIMNLPNPEKRTIYAREGFVIVSLSWILLSFFGALPFVFSGAIPSIVDAIFETVSGFTTTGASILTEIESLPKSILFWRSFTHWIGGMGVLVFVVAFVGNLSDRAIHILRAEMPGPVVGKIVPRAKDTSKVLYIMYIVLTLLQTILLWCGDMNLFEAVIHTFGTAGTGGFGLKADSIGGYSAYSQWVITAFMLVFGVNFNLYYLILIKRFRAVLKSTELWTYIGIAAVSATVIAFNIRGLFPAAADTVRTAAFQVATIMTTTGYATTDFNMWPQLSKSILLVLMFIGACAGSTAGGIKISRIVILFKMGIREIKRMIHPRSVGSVKFEGKDVDEHTKSSITTYFAVYMMCFFAIFLLLSFEGAPFDFESNFTAVTACFNNIGPGFGVVGPMGSYAGYSEFSKILLSFAMLLGRLEIFPLLIAMIPSTWKRR